MKSSKKPQKIDTQNSWLGMIVSFIKNRVSRGTQRWGWWMLLVLSAFLANRTLIVWVEQQLVNNDHVELTRHKYKSVGEF